MKKSGEWARAYAVQAQADLDAYNCLSIVGSLPRSQPLPRCQSLHFLQMSCEKLCTAYLCGKNTDLAQLQSTHASIAKVLPDIMKQEYLFAYGIPPRTTATVLKQIKYLAREIELLAPAVQDGGRRPDNCEYPWEDASGILRIPATHDFSNLTLLTHRSGTLLLKLLRLAIDRLA